MSQRSSYLKFASKTVSPIDISVRDLSVHIKSEAKFKSYVSKFLPSAKWGDSKRPSKVILDEVSARMPSGSLTAILGSSGSGKTTLLNAIAHRISPKSMDVAGSIVFHGNEKLKGVRRAYLMQDDILLPTLTVRETLQYAADLRLSSILTKEERNNVVEETILELGLKECATTRIGTATNSQCSGGEKRRTSIGVQLLSNPSVLLCDEPTTGQYHIYRVFNTS